MHRQRPRIANLDPSGRTPAHQLGHIDVRGTTCRLLKMGAWRSGAFYTPGNVVSDGGGEWLCVSGHTNHEPPNITYWDPFDQSHLILRGDRVWARAYTYVGTVGFDGADAFLTSDSPPFEAPWTNLGAPWELFRYRLVSPVKFDLEGGTIGGSVGDTITFVPAADRPARDLAIPGSSPTGVFSMLQVVASTGAIIKVS